MAREEADTHNMVQRLAILEAETESVAERTAQLMVELRVEKHADA